MLSFQHLILNELRFDRIANEKGQPMAALFSNMLSSDYCFTMRNT